MLEVVECPTCHSRSYKLRCGMYLSYTGVLSESNKELLGRQMLMSFIKKKESDCPRCDGKGKDPKDRVCELCNGEGKLDHLCVGDNEILVKDKAVFRG